MGEIGAAGEKLWAFTLLVEGERAGAAFLASYEVLAADAERAGRLVAADMAARGERLAGIEHAEASPVANPMAAEGVRFRVGRG
jgi:hypothetical protein